MTSILSGQIFGKIFLSSSPLTSTPYPHKYLGGKLTVIWTNRSDVGDHLSQTQHWVYCQRWWHPHFKENLTQPRDWNCPPPTHPVVVLWPSPCDISVQIRPRTSQSGWFSPKYGFVYNVGHLGHTDSHAVLTFCSEVKLHSILYRVYSPFDPTRL